MCRFGTYPCDFVHIPRQLFTPNVNSAQQRHVAGTQWGNKKYMNMKYLDVALGDAFIVS